MRKQRSLGRFEQIGRYLFYITVPLVVALTVAISHLPLLLMIGIGCLYGALCGRLIASYNVKIYNAEQVIDLPKYRRN